MIKPTCSLLIIIAVIVSLESICNEDFDETVCENIEFQYETMLESKTNKLVIRNATGTIYNENFSILNKVTQIEITRSVINSLEPGALCCVPKLTAIIIKENILFPTITKAMLDDCRDVKRLVLSNTRIASEAFNDLSNLGFLNFNNTLFERNIFKGLSSLKELTIHNSKIRTLTKNIFSDLKQLRLLNLQGNGIESIEPNAFVALKVLSFLNLSDNKLKSIIWDNFNGLTSLKILSLEYNEFDDVDAQKMMLTLPRLERVFFSWNTLSPMSRKNIETDLTKHNITFIYVGMPF